MRKEIAQLKESQADDLIAAARKAQPAKATELLRQAVDRNPGSLQAHCQLGIALRKIADYQGAINELKTAVELNEDSAEAWRELGVALSISEQLSDAVEGSAVPLS